VPWDGARWDGRTLKGKTRRKGDRGGKVQIWKTCFIQAQDAGKGGSFFYSK